MTKNLGQEPAFVQYVQLQVRYLITASMKFPMMSTDSIPWPFCNGRLAGRLPLDGGKLDGVSWSRIVIASAQERRNSRGPVIDFIDSVSFIALYIRLMRLIPLLQSRMRLFIRFHPSACPMLNPVRSHT